MTQLYVIAEGRNGPCKIGVTDRVMSTRLSEIQNGNPRRLTLEHSRECSQYQAIILERMAHAYAGHDKRMVGEWFDVPVKQAIEALDKALAERDKIVSVRYDDPLPPMTAGLVPKALLKPPSELYLSRREAQANRQTRQDVGRAGSHNAI